MKLRRSLLFFLLLVAGVALVGCAGEDGPAGAQGVQGEMGNKGPTGDTGPEGLPGEQGVKGDKGAKGEKGEKGEKGDPGVEVEFRVYNGVLQQKYTNEDDTKWRDVFFFNQMGNYVQKYTIAFDADGGVLEGETSITGIFYQSEVELPTPTKEGFTFAGWAAGEKVYKDKVVVENDLNLKATWEANRYTIVFQGEGVLPSFEGYASIQDFADEMVALFNNSGESGAVETNQDKFAETTHPNVKGVFGNAANLEKYKWFLEYVKEQLTIAATENGVLTGEMTDTGGNYELAVQWLDKMIAGDTNAVKEGGAAADLRTWFRQFIHRLINAENPNASSNKGTYNPWTIDYASHPEKVVEFLALANGGKDGKFGHGEKLPAAVYEGHFFDGWKDEEGNMVEVATKDCTLTAVYTKYEDRFFKVEFDLADGQFEEGYTAPTEVNPVTELPTPTKDGYEFLGWYDEDGNKVESVMEEEKLTAKWELITYTVDLDANGGLILEASLQDFADEIVELFNSTGKSDAVETTQNNFTGSTHPNVKYVFGNAEVLTKYKWFLEYAKKEIIEASKANNVYDVKMVSGGTGEEFAAWIQSMIDGDTEAVSISGNGAGFRTALRQFIHRLINAQNNKATAGNTSYNKYTVDFASKPEKVQEFLSLYSTGSETATFIVSKFDTLPTPVKDGFIFDGWYNGDVKVETVTENCVLVAKWNLAASFEVKPVIDSLLRLELATTGDLSQYDLVYFDVNGQKVYADKDGKFFYTGLLQNVILTHNVKLFVTIDGTQYESEVQTYNFPVLEGNVPVYTVTETEKLVGATAAFKARSLVIDGNLSVKYTLEAPETSKIVFKDKATGLVYKEYNVNVLEKDENGYYVIKLEIPANDWGMEISATICDQSNVALSSTNYVSVVYAMTATIAQGGMEARVEKIYRTLLKVYLG